jgi:DNA-binding MarR family transcriptional regulator
VDYRELAAEFFKDLHSLRKARPQKHISESLRGEAFALQYIAFHDGPVLPGEISGEMGISSARIAAALNSLEKKGLVTRRIDPEDRRRILVELTEQGAAQAQEHTEEVLNNITIMLSQLDEHDAREYVRITAILAKSIKGCGK